MLSVGALVRRAGAAARARPRTLHRNYNRKEWTNKYQSGELIPGSTSKLASPPMLKEAKERVYTPPLAYVVRRREPELIGPAAQRTRETKRLSDLDAMDILRVHVSLALFYRGGEGGVDPAGVIRRAIGEALVHYYPLAGRLREIEGRKLEVDCTGEGVLFVQADADVQLAELEAAGLRPPFPCWDQLLFDVEGSRGVLNCPLVLVQVTRLLCGGFVFALRFNHNICDGIGIAQFMNAVAELARGLPSPTLAPVWFREVLQARCQPMPSLPHCEFNGVIPPSPPTGDMVRRSFTFSASEISTIKKSLPRHLRDTATTFDALAAFLWRARTMALDIPPGEDAPLVITVNFKGNAKMGLPVGYYGNSVVLSTTLIDSAVLRDGSVGDATMLVRMAKATVTTEYVRSMVDALVLRDREWVVSPNMFVLSDARRLGLDRVDFGWGKPVFSGPTDTVFGTSFLIAGKDRYGEKAVVVPMVLPQLAMDRFAAEVDKLIIADVNPIICRLS